MTIASAAAPCPAVSHMCLVCCINIDTLRLNDAHDKQHIGSTFESWLDEQGIREEVTAAAIKAVILHQLAAAMKANNITKTGMAAKMQTSRAQLGRLLDPNNGGVALKTLQRAAKIVGREIRLELV